MRPQNQLDYQPGQYIDVRIDVPHDARGQNRTFTLTSLPKVDLLTFAVKIPAEHTPYKATLATLQPGDILSVSQAMGDLVLPRDRTRPLVFVAGGLGVASFISMLKQLTDNHETRNVTLHYAHKPDELLFQTITDTCPGLFVVHIVSPDRIDPASIVEGQPGNTLYYISGSEAFTLGYRDQLMSQYNINPTNIAYDYFDGYNLTDF